MQSGRSVLKKTAPLLVILGLAIGGAILLVATKPQAPPPESEEKVWVVTTQSAEPARHFPVVTLYGRIESARASRLTSSLSTEVMEILCEEGERVSKGQPLVRLDERDAQLRLKQRDAELAEIRALIASEKHRYDSDLRILESERRLQDLAQQEVARAQRLKAGKLAAQARIDEAQQVKLRQDIAVAQRQLAVRDHEARLARLQAQLKKAESLLAVARLDVERSLLRAPFDGRITRIPASPGNRTRPGEVLVELYALDALQVRAQVPNAKLASVETALNGGHALIARAQTGTRQRLDLQLTHLAGDIKPGRGGRDGLFELKNPGAELAIGDIVSLQLQLPAVEDSLALPREALYGNDRIYTIHDGRLKGHRVERLGETLDNSTAPPLENAQASETANWLLVRSASIAPGDLVVTTQLPNAVEGLKVRARRAATP
ncbi:MAG TPA: HlyD family efflux transporter periplasmic adaptor subunit [Gammaproteobacteria bacterium]|nr:HlyD family efflux transporter periplasmic adaptor subunit [Gammaproteobacteria bacterium]